ncbi:hypothetical protein OSTOST_04720 [Ostertagia ostertagi]
MNGSIRSRPETRRAKRKVTRLVLCVLIIWAVCWLPLNVCFFVSGLSYPETLVMKGGVIMVVIQISSQFKMKYVQIGKAVYHLGQPTLSCRSVEFGFEILRDYCVLCQNGFIRVICTMGRKLTMGAYCIQDDKIAYI